MQPDRVVNTVVLRSFFAAWANLRPPNQTSGMAVGDEGKEIRAALAVSLLAALRVGSQLECLEVANNGSK